MEFIVCVPAPHVWNKKDRNKFSGLKWDSNDKSGPGRRISFAMSFWLCAAIAAFASEAPIHQGQDSIAGAQAPFTNTYANKCVRTYQAYMEENNYIKEHKLIRTKGKNSYIEMITVNISSLHDGSRAWLAEQTAEVILVQEHRMTSLKAFGKIPGYEIIFSPARRTVFTGLIISM